MDYRALQLDNLLVFGVTKMGVDWRIAGVEW